MKHHLNEDLLYKVNNNVNCISRDQAILGPLGVYKFSTFSNSKTTVREIGRTASNIQSVQLLEQLEHVEAKE